MLAWTVIAVQAVRRSPGCGKAPPPGEHFEITVDGHKRSVLKFDAHAPYPGVCRDVVKVPTPLT